MSKPGRPSKVATVEGESVTPVHVRLSDSVYDRVYARASREHVTVPDIIRRAVDRDLETENCK
jgi:hypothetical protein